LFLEFLILNVHKYVLLSGFTSPHLGNFKYSFCPMKIICAGLVYLLPWMANAQAVAWHSNSMEPALEKVQTYPMFPVCEDYPGFNARDLCFKKQMDQYLATTLKYPESAKAQGIQGWVVVQYIVEKDGTIQEVKTIEDPGYGCGEEVARVLRALPPLLPGVHLGKIVRVKQTLSVQFTTRTY
jgi:TonB family protein